MFILFSLLFQFAIGVPNQQCDQTNRGLLSPQCVKHYQRIFLNREVPLRRYMYHHEIAGNLASPKNEYSWRIVGGKEVHIIDVPYSVLYGLYCGGVLLAPDWVITAAHCKDKEEFVYAGSTYRSKGTPYPVCAHFIHPEWFNTTKLHVYDFDYQLILLETPIPITPSSRPIVIGSPDDVRPGELVAVSGWGHLHFKGNKMQDIIHRVYMPIVDFETCKNATPAKYYSTITRRMFCAGYLNGTKDACQGDSGGPAVVRGKLIGLVSFGVNCAEPGRPGVYSDVTVMRDWIRAVTALPL